MSDPRDLLARIKEASQVLHEINFTKENSVAENFASTIKSLKEKEIELISYLFICLEGNKTSFRRANIPSVPLYVLDVVALASGGYKVRISPGFGNSSRSDVELFDHFDGIAEYLMNELKNTVEKAISAATLLEKADEDLRVMAEKLEASLQDAK